MRFEPEGQRLQDYLAYELPKSDLMAREDGRD